MKMYSEQESDLVLQKNDEKVNIAILCEYDGTDYLGWQSQKNNKTIQEKIQNAIFAITNEKVTLYGSSRTDAGVHAKGHVSNFISGCKIPVNKIPLALNSNLPDSISVKKAVIVPLDFNSRFQAKGKTYSYSIYNSPIRPAIDRFRKHHIPQILDASLMREASDKICGEHDFSSFMASNSEVKSTVRNIYSIEIIDKRPDITIYVRGNGFLYNMVRIIAGTLCYAGLGKIEPGQIDDIIKSGDRRLSGKTLPANGLCLEEVYYDSDIFNIAR